MRELVACAHGGGSGGSAGGESRTAARYPAARLFLMIVIGTLPLFLVLPVNDYVEQLYSHTAFIGIALILTGCILYVADKMALGKKTEGSMRIRDALIIGVCQGIATIPGLSRSGTTIAAGMLLRKHLTGARIASVTQPEGERMVLLDLDTRDELGVESRKRLVAELMGRSANIILVGPDGVIVDCARRMDFGGDAERRLLPGMIRYLLSQLSGFLCPKPIFCRRGAIIQSRKCKSRKGR